MNEGYEKVDAYLSGFRAATNAAFCPETGWFWDVLSRTHGKSPRVIDVDEFYDAIVEAVNEELGR